MLRQIHKLQEFADNLSSSNEPLFTKWWHAWRKWVYSVIRVAFFVDLQLHCLAKLKPFIHPLLRILSIVILFQNIMFHQTCSQPREHEGPSMWMEAYSITIRDDGRVAELVACLSWDRGPLNGSWHACHAHPLLCGGHGTRTLSWDGKFVHALLLFHE